MFYTIKFTGLLMATLLLASCDFNDIIDTNPGNDTNSDEQVIIKYDKNINYGDEPEINIHFVDVLQDSRCPVKVECVWEGDATVKLALMTPPLEKITYIELHTNNKFQTTAEYDGYEIQLKDLIPYPEEDNDIDKSEYKAVLDIKKL